MTDVLIRNVPDEDLARIDEQAARLGLSRNEYLRRRIIQEASRGRLVVTRADLDRFADRGSDLLDDNVMRGAWT
jgi:hypothetical protein